MIRARWVWAVVCAVVMLTVAASVVVSRHDVLFPAASTLSSPDAWVPYGGDWAANAARIQNNSQERGAKLMVRDGAWTDYQVEADLQMAEPYGEAGLMLRSSGEEEGVDTYHGYFAGVRTMDNSFTFGRADFGWHSLVHKSLPADADLHGPLHLRVIAVGCRFAVSITLPDGRESVASSEDADCIRTGRFGLRSSLTSASWRNLRVSAVGAEEMLAVEEKAAETRAEDLPDGEPFAPPALNRYASSILAEAKTHESPPGTQPIIDFLMSPGSHPHVRIRGSIISTPPLTDIQDGSSALIIPNIDPKTPIKLGDVVEAEGTVVSSRFRSELDDAKIKVLWSDAEIPPLAVTASQLTSGTYRGRTIEVEGVLRSMSYRPDGYDLILQDGGLSFRALGSKDFQLDRASLDIGSRLRLRGLATSLTQFTDGLYPFAVITTRVDTVSPPPWWSTKHIVLLTAAFAGVLLLAQILLHRLQQWHIRSVLKEREQLAFEMHDTLAQSFTGIAYQLQAASVERQGVDMMQTHIRSALEMVKVSHREASRTIAALRPQYRDAAGILSALKESAERLSDGGGLVITTTLNGRLMELPLEVTDVFFRIGQEAISNAIQHSECTALGIGLTLSRREAQLSIRDDGQGFDEKAVVPGLGLDSMRKRAAKIKARFELDATPGMGTTITVVATPAPARGWLYRVRAKLTSTSLGADPG